MLCVLLAIVTEHLICYLYMVHVSALLPCSPGEAYFQEDSHTIHRDPDGSGATDRPGLQI